MNIALRLLLTLFVAVAIAACKTTEPAPEPSTDDTTTRAPAPVEVTTAPALDPTDYTNKENFTNPESLLSKNVIYFDFDRSNVKAEYRDIVAAHATYLGSNSIARVTLEGHADERGTREYNLGLAERRGNSVTGLLTAGGGSASQLGVVSYGEERPVCRVSNEDCWWQNRRVEIVYTAR
jgi:peptidoglycan-associated lipoprotein